MSPNNTKPWWQSTTIWAGAGQILIMALALVFGGDPQPGDAAAASTALEHVVMGLLGLGAIIGRLRATKKIG